MNNTKKPSKSYSIISLIFAISLIVTLIVIVILGLYWYKTTNKIEKQYVKTIDVSYKQSAKQYTKSTVKNLIKLIDEDRKNLISNTKLEISLHPRMLNFYKGIIKAYDGNLPESKAKSLMQHYLINLTTTFSPESYYIFDIKGNCVVNPFYLALNSKNLLNLQDFKGNFIIKDIIKAAKTKNSVFIKQYWPSGWDNLKPENINRPGITFVQYDKRFNWIFVTRVDTELLMENLKRKWMHNLSIYRYGKKEHGYIFVFRLINLSGGKCFSKQIVNPNKPEAIGECLSDNTTNIKLNRFRKNYLKDLRLNGYAFLDYYYKKPDSNKKREKIAYMELYKPWGWLIGTGIYLDDIQPIIDAAKQQAKNQTMSIMKIIAVVAVFAVLFSMLFYIFLIKVVQKSIYRVFRGLEKSLKQATYIDESGCKINEIKRIAKNFNNSIKQFQLYEEEFIESFVNFMEARDIYTKGHSQRIAHYAKSMALELGLDEKIQDTIYKAGLLHDIGKIGIPDNILLKPGKLTENEYNIMKYHPVFSYEMLKNLDHFKYLADCVRSHHEKCDGSGYPDNLTCDKISLCAKILAIADIFDALTTTRPYRHSFSVDEAVKILKKEKVDQDILEKAEKRLIEALIKEDNVEVTFMSKEIDILRNNIFTVDYMTGLKLRSVFLKNIQNLIDNNKSFVFIRMNIKKMSNINYVFSEQVGDEIIIHTAKALINMGKKLRQCDVNLLARSHADIFYAAHVLPDNADIGRAEKIEEFAKKELLKEFFESFSHSPSYKLKDKDGKPITEYVDFQLTHAIYPHNAKTISELIYISEKKGRLTE